MLTRYKINGNVKYKNNKSTAKYIFGFATHPSTKFLFLPSMLVTNFSSFYFQKQLPNSFAQFATVKNENQTILYYQELGRLNQKYRKELKMLLEEIKDLACKTKKLEVADHIYVSLKPSNDNKYIAGYFPYLYTFFDQIYNMRIEDIQNIIRYVNAMQIYKKSIENLIEKLMDGCLDDTIRFDTELSFAVLHTTLYSPSHNIFEDAPKLIDDLNKLEISLKQLDNMKKSHEEEIKNFKDNNNNKFAKHNNNLEHNIGC